MPILVLVKKVICLFCALSGLTMSLPTRRTTNKTSLKIYNEKWDWRGVGGGLGWGEYLDEPLAILLKSI